MENTVKLDGMGQKISQYIKKSINVRQCLGVKSINMLTFQLCFGFQVFRNRKCNAKDEKIYIQGNLLGFSEPQSMSSSSSSRFLCSLKLEIYVNSIY